MSDYKNNDEGTTGIAPPPEKKLKVYIIHIHVLCVFDKLSTPFIISSLTLLLAPTTKNQTSTDCLQIMTKKKKTQSMPKSWTN
jgi:hypothetical protein